MNAPDRAPASNPAFKWDDPFLLEVEAVPARSAAQPLNTARIR